MEEFFQIIIQRSKVENISSKFLQLLRILLRYIDRHELQFHEFSMVRWASFNNIAFIILYTKIFLEIEPRSQITCLRWKPTKSIQGFSLF